MAALAALCPARARRAVPPWRAGRESPRRRRLPAAGYRPCIPCSTRRCPRTAGVEGRSLASRPVPACPPCAAPPRDRATSGGRWRCREWRGGAARMTERPDGLTARRPTTPAVSAAVSLWRPQHAINSRLEVHEVRARHPVGSLWRSRAQARLQTLQLEPRERAGIRRPGGRGHAGEGGELRRWRCHERRVDETVHLI